MIVCNDAIVDTAQWLTRMPDESFTQLKHELLAIAGSNTLPSFGSNSPSTLTCSPNSVNTSQGNGHGNKKYLTCLLIPRNGRLLASQSDNSEQFREMLDIVAENLEPACLEAIKYLKLHVLNNEQVLIEFLNENKFLKIKGYRVIDALFDDYAGILGIIVRQVTKNYAVQAISCCERLYLLSTNINRRPCLWLAFGSWIKKNKASSSQKHLFAMLEARLLVQKDGIKDYKKLNELSQRHFEPNCTINGLAVSARLSSVTSRISNMDEIDFENGGVHESIDLVNLLLSPPSSSSSSSSSSSNASSISSLSRRDIEYKKIVKLIRNSNFFKPIMVEQDVSEDLRARYLDTMNRMLEQDLQMVAAMTSPLHCITCLLRWFPNTEEIDNLTRIKIARVLVPLIEHCNITAPTQLSQCAYLLVNLLKTDPTVFTQRYFLCQETPSQSVCLGVQALKCLGILRSKAPPKLRSEINWEVKSVLLKHPEYDDCTS